jgi:hypothetical protein
MALTVYIKSCYAIFVSYEYNVTSFKHFSTWAILNEIQEEMISDTMQLCNNQFCSTVN